MELCKGLLEKSEEVVVVPEMQKLTSDAVYEILTRVMLVNLLRQCQWVCKDWQKLILCDTKFQKKHLQNTPNMRPGCFVYDHVMKHIKFAPYVVNDRHENKSPTVSSPFLDFLPKSANDIIIGCSSQFGSLLYCVTLPESFRIPSYYICKPATREWRKIPNPKTSLAGHRKVRTSIAVTKSYPMLQFKILRLSASQTGFGQHCEVFDSTNWTWKRNKFIKITKCIGFKQAEAIFLNGGFHWSTYSDHIFVYYVDQEKWAWLKFSRDMRGRCCPDFVVNCDGKLGVIFYDKEWMEVWILENYCTTKPIWKRKFRNDIRWIYENNPAPMRMYHPVGMWSGDTVVMVSYDEIAWFNCEKDTKTIIPCTSTSHIFSMFHPEFSYC